MRKFLAAYRNEWSKMLGRTNTRVFLGLILVAIFLATIAIPSVLKTDYEHAARKDFSARLVQLKESMEWKEKDLIKLKEKIEAAEDALVKKNLEDQMANVEKILASDKQVLEVIKLFEQRGYSSQGMYYTIVDWFHGLVPAKEARFITTDERGRQYMGVTAEQKDALIEAAKESKLAFWQKAEEIVSQIPAETEREDIIKQERLNYTRFYQKFCDLDDLTFQNLTRKAQEEFMLKEDFLLAKNQGYISGPFQNYGVGIPITPSIEAKLDATIQRAKLLEEHPEKYYMGQLNNFRTQSEYTLSLVSFFLVILGLVLAASSVASEMSSGTVKFLLLVPCKRRRIYWAKIFSLLSFTFIVTFLASVIILVISSVMYGGMGGQYLFVSGKTIVDQPYAIHFLSLTFWAWFEASCYTLVAFVLSSWTRSQVLSLSLSFVAYFASSMVNALPLLVGGGFWLNILPYQHIQWVPRLFPNFYDHDLFRQIVQRPTVTESVVYIALVAITLLWIGRDQFVRKDI